MPGNLAASDGSATLGLSVTFSRTAGRDSVTSAQALADTYHERVTVRDRMGRTLVFLTRMLAEHKLREARRHRD